MRSARLLAILVCLVTAGFLVGPAGAGGVDSIGVGADGDGVNDSEDNEDGVGESDSIGSDGESGEREENHAVGSSLSTFMQSSSADASNAVDSGMYEARYESADAEDRADVVNERIDELEASAANLDDHGLDSEDSVSPNERAKLTRTAVELHSLNESIDRVEQQAAESGADTDRVDELRTDASKLSGPEITAHARNISGIDPPGGPSDEPPGQANESPGENPQGVSDDVADDNDPLGESSAGEEGGSDSTGDER